MISRSRISLLAASADGFLGPVRSYRFDYRPMVFYRDAPPALTPHSEYVLCPVVCVIYH
jgi:hypothetical protein